MSAIFEMSDDVVYGFRGSWCATGLPSGFPSHWRVIGTKGTVLWDGADDLKCEVEAGDQGFQRPVKAVEIPGGDFEIKTQGHGGLIREFLDSIGGANAPETRAKDNIKSLKMVLGVVESAETSGK